MPSERQRFTMVVIGRIRAGRQDFKSEVGMGSREQVALDEQEIAIEEIAIDLGLYGRLQIKIFWWFRVHEPTQPSTVCWNCSELLGP